MGSRSSIKKAIITGLAVSSSTLLLAACGSSSTSTPTASSGNGSSAATAGASAPFTITIGDPGKSATLWPIYVGQDEGFFKKNNLVVNTVSTTSSSGSAQELITGAINIASAGIPDFIRAINGGASEKIVAAGVNQPIYNIVAAKNITSWSQLAGKRVIVGGPSDITRYYFDTVAKANGLNPSTVTLTYAGATSARYAALIGGGVSAAILASPFDAQAINAGYHGLGTVAKFLPDSPFTALGVGTTWATKHSAQLKSFIKALSESITWLNDPSNKATAEALLMKETQSTQASVDSAYSSLITELKVFPNSGTVSSSALGSLLNGLVKAGFLPSSTSTDPAHYLDNSFAQ